MAIYDIEGFRHEIWNPAPPGSTKSLPQQKDNSMKCHNRPNGASLSVQNEQGCPKETGPAQNGVMGQTAARADIYVLKNILQQQSAESKKNYRLYAEEPDLPEPEVNSTVDIYQVIKFGHPQDFWRNAPFIAKFYVAAEEKLRDINEVVGQPQVEVFHKVVGFIRHVAPVYVSMQETHMGVRLEPAYLLAETNADVFISADESNPHAEFERGIYLVDIFVEELNARIYGFAESVKTHADVPSFGHTKPHVDHRERAVIGCNSAESPLDSARRRGYRRQPVGQRKTTAAQSGSNEGNGYQQLLHLYALPDRTPVNTSSLYIKELQVIISSNWQVGNTFL